MDSTAYGPIAGFSTRRLALNGRNVNSDEEFGFEIANLVFIHGTFSNIARFVPRAGTLTLDLLFLTCLELDKKMHRLAKSVWS